MSTISSGRMKMTESTEDIFADYVGRGMKMPCGE